MKPGGSSFDVRRASFDSNAERRTTKDERPLVVKFGGELVEDRAHLATVVTGLAAIAARAPVVVVHGGGKEIDAALNAADIEKRQVDGLRITDEATLDVVVSVLAGAVNTRVVAALNAAGIGAVGLTGADGLCGLSEAAPPHHATDGRIVDLDRVGVPIGAADTRLLEVLVGAGFVPVIASIGIGADGRLFNVNADTFAGHLAARLGARRLIVAGTTPGVRDRSGATLAELDTAAVARLVADGTATAGMIAKLRACEYALAGGVEDVVIVDGRDRAALEAAAAGAAPGSATRIVADARTRTLAERLRATPVGRDG